MDPIATAYDALARVYDDLTVDHDYDAWTRTLERLATDHGMRGRRLLDLACGTGKSFMPFALRGFEVTACDISPGMLERAATKAPPGVRLLQADMRALPDGGHHDLVTCLDDAVNYLGDEGELTSAFGSVARSLAPGGVFLFDVNTLAVYRSLFATDNCSELDGCFFALRGEAAPTLPSGSLAPLTIEAFRREPDGSWLRLTSHHDQRHHAHEAVLRALRAAGLACTAVHGLTPDGVLHAEVEELQHTKRVYVATAMSPVRGEEVSHDPHQEAGEADRPGRRFHQVELTDGPGTPTAAAPSGMPAGARR
ncbi:MAG: class I SAM-dependent methyltransferase [Thermoleophilaceae bacterium]